MKEDNKTLVIPVLSNLITVEQSTKRKPAKLTMVITDDLAQDIIDAHFRKDTKYDKIRLAYDVK